MIRRVPFDYAQGMPCGRRGARKKTATVVGLCQSGFLTQHQLLPFARCWAKTKTRLSPGPPRRRYAKRISAACGACCLVS